MKRIGSHVPSFILGVLVGVVVTMKACPPAPPVPAGAPADPTPPPVPAAASAPPAPVNAPAVVQEPAK